MYIANNELIKNDKRIKVSKIGNTNTNVTAVMQHMIIIIIIIIISFCATTLFILMFDFKLAGI